VPDPRGSGSLTFKSKADIWASVEELEKEGWNVKIILDLLGVCPVSLAEPDTKWLFKQVIRFMNYKKLPYGGGMLDQPNKFIEALDIVSAEVQRLMPKD